MARRGCEEERQPSRVAQPGEHRLKPGDLEALRNLKMKTALPSSIESLFERYPALCGFSVRGLDELPDNCPRSGEEDGEFFVGDIGVSSALNREQLGEMIQQIVVALAELLAEEPAAGESLRGRTFARVLH